MYQSAYCTVYKPAWCWFLSNGNEDPRRALILEFVGCTIETTPMGFDWTLLYKPAELRAIAQWKLWHDPVNQREPETESENIRKCYVFLDQTSRSFSSVIQELKPELREPVRGTTRALVANA